MIVSPTPELFRHYPELRERVPWAPLARATPVHRLERLESYVQGPAIWVKRDDRTSDIFGGGKARKLEFVFGDILRRGSRRLLTFGAVGSNHCLAVTAFAHHFNLMAILGLVRRPPAGHVQRTLQLEHELGAELHRLDGGPRALWRLARRFFSGRGEDGDPRLPYIIWPRRAALLGTLGYANAAYELRRQINCGVLPEPARIYVATGTGATLAGLALGCELAGIRSRLVGVVAPGHRPGSARALARRSARHLKHRAPQFPSLHIRNERFDIRRQYASWSDSVAPQQAQGLLRDLESLDLDATYTSRAMAALLEDCRSGQFQGPVLFWHTYAPNIFSRQPSSSAEALPREFHEFFVAP